MRFLTLLFLSIFFLSVGNSAFAQNPEVSATQITEAENIRDWCESNHKVYTSMRCDCLAEGFLKKRAELGPTAEKNTIIGQLENPCKNIVGTTEVEHSRCMGGIGFRNTNGIERKKYCDCYAKTWAEQFEKYEERLSVDAKQSMRGVAMSYCQNPEAYN